MRTSGNVPFPAGTMAGLETESLLSLEGVWCEGSRGRRAAGGTFITNLARTQVVTLAGSMVSDPSLGCSSL